MSAATFGHLIVGTESLQTAAKRLNRVLSKRDKSSVELTLSFSAGMLVLETPGAMVDVPANGTWPGRARISLNFAMLLSKMPPRGDSLTLEFQDGFLFVRGTTVLRFPGSWQDISANPIELPLDLSDLALLQARSNMPSAVIISSGLNRATELAELRFQKALDRAHRSLAKYGITRNAFEQVVRDLIVNFGHVLNSKS